MNPENCFPCLLTVFSGALVLNTQTLYSGLIFHNMKMILLHCCLEAADSGLRTPLRFFLVQNAMLKGNITFTFSLMD